MNKRQATKIMKSYALMAAPERHHPHQIAKATTILNRKQRRAERKQAENAAIAMDK